MSHLELEQLYKTEEEVAAQYGPSSTPADIAYQILGLPQDPSGLVVVDLATGTSGLVELLLQKGADAFGVDSAFSDPLKIIMQKATTVLEEQTEYAPLGFQRAMFDLGADSIAKFALSHRKDPQRYIASYLTRVSLPSNFADWTTSLNGLSSIWDNPKLTLEALKEAHRITKPGGRIVLSPIHLGYDYEEYLAAEHAEIIGTIDHLGLGQVQIEREIVPDSPVPVGSWNRLTIFKH